MKRVVVTGLGLLTSIGNNKEDTWKNLINLKSGIKKITHFDTDGLSCKIAGHISDDENDPQNPVRPARCWFWGCARSFDCLHKSTSGL